MWRDHPFSQRNKTTERAVGVRFGDNRERGSWTIFEKREAKKRQKRAFCLYKRSGKFKVKYLHVNSLSSPYNGR